MKTESKSSDTVAMKYKKLSKKLGCGLGTALQEDPRDAFDDKPPAFPTKETDHSEEKKEENEMVMDDSPQLVAQISISQKTKQPITKTKSKSSDAVARKNKKHLKKKKHTQEKEHSEEKKKENETAIVEEKKEENETAIVAKKKGFDTIALHGGYEPDPNVPLGLGKGAPRGVPVYRTTPFVFKDTQHAANLFALKELGNIYSRIMNPTNHVLESRYAQLEGGHPLSGLAVASGTNAIFYSVINLASKGDNIVSASALYGGTYTMFNDILPDMGIEVRFVDGSDPKNFSKAADEKTRAFFCESVSNPSLEIFDIEEIANNAHALGLPLIVDSTFSTPYLCRPFDHGADILANSCTKWIGGHGSCVGGIIVDKGGFNWKGGKHPLYDIPDTSYGGENGLRWGHDLPPELAPLAFKLRALTVPLRNLGGCMSPDNAWMIVQGIETLSLRMERHCESAHTVAEYLNNHPKVSWVRYPGLKTDSQFEKAQKYLNGKGGAMVVFGIKSKDAHKAGQEFIDSLGLFSHVANVGDARSLAIHPATTTHSQLHKEQQLAAGVLPELVRLSIGLESVDDIIDDLEQALAKVN